MDLRKVYVETAEAVLGLVEDPAVRDRWSEPSALAGMTVGGLAAHLARAVHTVERYLDDPSPATATPLLDPAGYVLSVLPDPTPTSDVNREVLARAMAGAEDGPEAVADAARAALLRLAPRLATEPGDRRVAVRDGVAMVLYDYLATRLVELVVHADDLAASAPVAQPPVPVEAEAVTVGVLAEVARRRSSTSAMVRTLARRERAPSPVPRAF